MREDGTNLSEQAVGHPLRLRGAANTGAEAFVLAVVACVYEIALSDFEAVTAVTAAHAGLDLDDVRCMRRSSKCLGDFEAIDAAANGKRYAGDLALNDPDGEGFANEERVADLK